MMEDAAAQSKRSPETAGREVEELIWASCAAAAVVSLLDGVLLELRRGFFRGGFLAFEAATTWSDRAWFLVGSLVVDLVIASAGVLLAQAVAARLRWGAVPRRLLALLLGAGPLVLASLAQYQVLARLGDAFDLGLMFELVNRRVGEFVAVSAAQLAAPVLATVVGGAVAFGILRMLARRFPAGVRPSPSWRTLALWLAGALVAMGASTWLRVSSDVQDNGLRRKPAGQVLGAIVTFASDVDRDGFGLLSRPPDPAPFDARVYPYALDVPGNGIDEDGVGGDLPSLDTPAPPVAPPVVFAQRPPVVMVMLETFRADLLGAREGGTPVTPTLDALAAAGAASTEAYSHNGYTVQSRFHLFTGGLATRPGQTTLLDDFRRNGYEIGYFSAQDESFGGTAFDIGAERADRFYDARQDRDRRSSTFTTAGSLGVSSSVLLERVGQYLGARDAARPLFLYVNFYDTHYPYWHRDMAAVLSDVRVPQAGITQARAADVRRMYRNAAAHVDRAVGDLLRQVRTHVGREPVVVVLADHGESLFDDGFLGHGYVLDDAQTRIPLVVSGAAMTFCEPVGQVDVRAALVTALAQPESSARPTFSACEGQRVFQYLGTLDRARQIAWRTRDDRVIFDVRDGRVRGGASGWSAPERLPASSLGAFQELVHTWERLRYGGRATGTADDPR